MSRKCIYNRKECKGIVKPMYVFKKCSQALTYEDIIGYANYCEYHKEEEEKRGFIVRENQ